MWHERRRRWFWFISNSKWVLPGGSITTTIHHNKCTSHIHNTHISYTQLHLSHKITTKQTNKQDEENKSAHKATQTVKDILQPLNTALKKVEVILDTGYGGLFTCEISRLSYCLDNRFIVGGLVARRSRFTTQNHLRKYLLVLIYVRDWANLMIMMRLEGWGALNYIQLPHGQSKPRASDLRHCASINYTKITIYKH
jgi:hypothetical protein